MLCINESGLYAATFRSRKPSAKAFRRWVTSEVLPSIRRTGGYVHPAAADSLQAQLSLAAEIGGLRDDFRAMQQEFVGVLKSHVKTSERCVRLQRQVGNLKDRIATRARIDSAIVMLAAGRARAEIANALGITRNYLRQIALDARRDGRLPPDDDAQRPLL